MMNYIDRSRRALSMTFKAYLAYSNAREVVSRFLRSVEDIPLDGRQIKITVELVPTEAEQAQARQDEAFDDENA